MKTLSVTPQSQNSFKALKIGDKAFGAVKQINKISSPGQRAILGATALLIQPVIDYSNDSVDKTTKETAAARSISKAVVCATTGVIIRELCIKLSETLTKPNKPFYIEALKDGNKNAYAKVLGTAIATVIMIVTNFLIDAPVTNICQNLITKYGFGHPQKEEGEGAK